MKQSHVVQCACNSPLTLNYFQGISCTANFILLQIPKINFKYENKIIKTILPVQISSTFFDVQILFLKYSKENRLNVKKFVSHNRDV